nr:universal stress protein [Propionibacterium sp.]
MTTTGPTVRIVVGCDGSDDARAALRFAAAEAISRDGVLHLVNAIDDTVLNSAWGIVFDVEAVRQGGLDLLQQAREEAQALGVPAERIEADCLVGQPAAVLSRLSETSSLVIVGRRAESGEHSMFVGSTAVGLAGTATCPVVVVSELNRPDDAPRHVIGVGLDPGAPCRLAVEWAVKRAKRLGSRVVAMSVVKPPAAGLFRSVGRTGPTDDEKTRLFASIRGQVEATVAAVTAEVPGVDIDLQFRYGSPTDELIELSRQVDLLIVGVHPSFPTYSVGGKVRALMTHSACPLGLIRYK